MFLLNRLYGWLAAAGAAVLLLASAVFYGWRKGRHGVQAAVAVDQARQQANTAAAIVNRNEVRTDVDAQVARLPASPVGPVTVPAPLPVPGSAADELRQQWSRD